MDDLCGACSCGPARIDGHPDLMVRAVGSGEMSFQCRLCGSFWSRTSGWSGDFHWAEISERIGQSRDLGVAVPPLAMRS